MSAGSVCNVCREPSGLKCGNCREVSYCSKDHQKQDWKNHKSNCLSYKIEKNEKLGRHLIAARTIAEGEIIIRESPLVSGPPQVTPPVCLGCYQLLSEFTTRDCSTCGWPVCSELCEKSAAHRPECQITAQHKNGKVKINTFQNDLPHPTYQSLTVLRCLYLKKAQPKLWEKLMALESHCEERKETVKYNSDQVFIAKFIPTFFNFTDFSEEEILKIAGIVQVNAHEIPLTEPGHIGIYEKASMLEHNCRANCMKSFTNDGDVVIRAAAKISPGDHLSICYTDPLWSRDTRLNHLMETKFFLCQCPRCLDPTEFGTHFNSLKCLKRECPGYSIPLTQPAEVLSVNNEKGIKQLWKCQKCNATSSEEYIALLQQVIVSLEKCDKKNVQSCQQFLQKYEKSLHPNHNVLVNVKLALIDLFGWQDKLITLGEQELEWTINTCRDVYHLASTLVPAENRLRGVLLFQWQFALTEQGRRKASRLEADPAQTTENLLECRSILTKAYKLLSYEPDELPEGKMAIKAKTILANLEKYLQSAVAVIN